MVDKVKVSDAKVNSTTQEKKPEKNVKYEAILNSKKTNINDVSDLSMSADITAPLLDPENVNGGEDIRDKKIRADKLLEKSNGDARLSLEDKSNDVKIPFPSVHLHEEENHGHSHDGKENHGHSHDKTETHEHHDEHGHSHENDSHCLDHDKKPEGHSHNEEGHSHQEEGHSHSHDKVDKDNHGHSHEDHGHSHEDHGHSHSHGGDESDEEELGINEDEALAGNIKDLFYIQ